MQRLEILVRMRCHIAEQHLIDFVPHEFEFLRDEHAHVRLGVSDDMMERWASEAELRIADSRKLEPLETAEAPLGVALWLVEKEGSQVNG